MASLHPAAGSPAALDRRVFSASHHPFLKSEPLGPGAPGAPLPLAGLAGLPAESVEVTVLWGSTVLEARQLTPPRRFAAGEVGGADGVGVSAAVDFALSAERLGSERCEIVAVRGGAPFAVFRGEGAPRVVENGRAVDAAGIVVDCSDVGPGARGVELCQGRVVLIEAGGVTFRVAGTEKPARVPRAVLAGADRSALAALGGAALLQGLLVASLAYFTPSMAWGSDAELERNRLVLMQQYLHARAERNRQEQPAPDAQAGGEKGAPAAASKGPEGKSGRPDTPVQQRRAGIEGQHPERIVGRAELVKEASSFGTIGLLSALNASNAPSSPWGAELAMGPDAANGMGDLWGDQIGDVAGTGLGLGGVGLGAGGLGAGIGVGVIGTCMGVSCYGNGDGGFGRSAALTSRGHQTKAPRVALHPPVLSGRLPADVIQRIVRQNFGRFRQCYEVGLRNNPNLEGRVTARFVIGRDGAVSNVSAGGDLPDSAVRSCVASAFYGLSFPSPENGIVTVSYPILLTPG